MCLLGPGKWWKYDGYTIITAKLVVAWKRVLRDKSAGSGCASGTGKDCRLRIWGLVSPGIEVYWGCMSLRLVARSSSLLYAQFARRLEVGHHDDELVAATIRRRGENAPLVYLRLCTGALTPTCRIEDCGRTGQPINIDALGGDETKFYCGGTKGFTSISLNLKIRLASRKLFDGRSTLTFLTSPFLGPLPLTVAS
jgi:hypothetical protein